MRDASVCVCATFHVSMRGKSMREGYIGRVHSPIRTHTHKHVRRPIITHHSVCVCTHESECIWSLFGVTRLARTDPNCYCCPHRRCPPKSLLHWRNSLMSASRPACWCLASFTDIFDTAHDAKPVATETVSATPPAAPRSTGL